MRQYGAFRVALHLNLTKEMAGETHYVAMDENWRSSMRPSDKRAPVGQTALIMIIFITRGSVDAHGRLGLYHGREQPE
jgi:hypothetical protein